MNFSAHQSTRGLSLAALALLVTCGATAAPASASAAKPAPTRYCSVLLDPIKPGEKFSRVVREACADTEEAAAKSAGTTASTLLLQLATDINMGGTVKNWNGTAGPCDTAGYGIRNLGDFNDTMSSWRQGHSRCNYVNVWTDEAYQGKHTYWHNWTQVNYVGADFNDQITSIHVHYEP
ncbi:hypothetical protein ACQP2T_27540 [Nonomuraea sp. CA-143628]|uniref:hypothetical protein n=1 Tax=Nonomuraea sp. CA-143628 TaxID=3239997 RepID=UPI003D8A4A2D